MNWLLLFTIFNATLFMCAVKINFFPKTNSVELTLKAYTHERLIFNL